MISIGQRKRIIVNAYQFCVWEVIMLWKIKIELTLRGGGGWGCTTDWSHTIPCHLSQDRHRGVSLTDLSHKLVADIDDGSADDYVKERMNTSTREDNSYDWHPSSAGQLNERYIKSWAI